MPEKNLLQESKEILFTKIDVRQQSMKQKKCKQDKHNKLNCEYNQHYVNDEQRINHDNINQYKLPLENSIRLDETHNNEPNPVFISYDKMKNHDIQSTYQFQKEHFNNLNNHENKYASREKMEQLNNERIHHVSREQCNRTGDYRNGQFNGNDLFYDKYHPYFPFGYYPQQMNNDNSDLINQGMYHLDHYMPLKPAFYSFYYPGYPNPGIDYRKFKNNTVSNEEKQFYDPIIFMTDNQEMEKMYIKPEKSCSAAKPSFSYSQLITKAIETSENGILTLNEIYSWIRNNYEYYRLTDSTWQNSIRHNLSLNKMFKKVARPSNKPGKGGFWTIDYDYLAKGSPRMKGKKKKFYAECTKNKNCKSIEWPQREYESNESDKIEVTEIDFYNEYSEKNNEM